MKKIKFLALALFFASFCLVACERPTPDPDPDNGGGQEQGGDQGDPSDPDYIDLSTCDFMKYVWTITEVECPDISENIMSKLQAAIRTKSLIFDNFGLTGAADYANWGMNLSINMQSQFAFFVKYYRISGGKHLLSFTAGSTVYTGEIIMTQDDKNIYATFTGKSDDGSKQTKFACYLAKK